METSYPQILSDLETFVPPLRVAEFTNISVVHLTWLSKMTEVKVVYCFRNDTLEWYVENKQTKFCQAEKGKAVFGLNQILTHALRYSGPRFLPTGLTWEQIKKSISQNFNLSEQIHVQDSMDHVTVEKEIQNLLTALSYKEQIKVVGNLYNKLIDGVDE